MGIGFLSIECGVGTRTPAGTDERRTCYNKIFNITIGTDELCIDECFRHITMSHACSCDFFGMRISSNTNESAAYTTVNANSLLHFILCLQIHRALKFDCQRLQKPS